MASTTMTHSFNLSHSVSLGGYDERDMGVVRLGTCIVP